MSPAVQSIIAAAVVLLAMLYVGRRAWRSLAKGRGGKDAGCGSSGSGCGCGDSGGE